MALSKQTQQTLFEAGYVAKGIVYCLIGLFAAGTLVGLSRSGANGPKAIIEWIGTNPFGKVFVAAIGLGLLSYAVWRLYKSSMDTENEGNNASGVIKRIAWAISGLAYATLAVFAFRQVLSSSGGSGGGKKQDVIQLLLQQSWGQIAVAVLGVILVGMAGYQIYRAYSDKLMKKVKSQHLSKEKQETFRVTGRLGLTSRAVVYGIISYFLFRAALLDDASQFKGISGSLSYLESGFGTTALVVIGVGLLCYGIFMFVRAKYEKV